MKNRKDIILEVAEEEFARNGYEGANICRIAKKVGVTHVLLYYHFQNKENLFMEVLQRKIDGFIQSVLPPQETETLYFIKNLDNLVAQNFDFIAENAAFAKLIVNESTSLPSLADIAHTRYREYLERLQHALDVEQAAGNIAATNAEQLVLNIFSLNIMSVVVMPSIEALLPDTESDRAEVLKRRKEENIERIHLLLGVRDEEE